MSDKVEKQESSDFVKLRFTLSSPSAKRLEITCAEIVGSCRSHSYVPHGPVRLPTKVLTVTTRKTPNGEGSKTWDTYEMRVHKRIILVRAPTAEVARFVSKAVDPKVNLTVTIAE